MFPAFIKCSFLITFFLFIFAYFQLKAEKMNYSSRKKVINLLDEQKNIFNKLPDGAIIHKTKSNIRKQQNKMISASNRKSQIANAQPGIVNVNYTLKQMLGIPISEVEGDKA